MALNMTPELWQALCLAAAMYPTCTLRLRQHQGWVKSFTVEHGPGDNDVRGITPPLHVHPQLVTPDVYKTHSKKRE